MSQEHLSRRGGSEDGDHESLDKEDKGPLDMRHAMSEEYDRARQSGLRITQEGVPDVDEQKGDDADQWLSKNDPEYGRGGKSEGI